MSMRMPLPTIIGGLLWAATNTTGVASSQADPAFPCFKHHGRLMGGLNGISTRLWLIGTNRVLAVDGGVQLPGDANKYFDPSTPDFSVIYGDFEICPVEPDVPGAARRVEVNGFEKLVVQKLKDSSQPPFRLLSTWPKQHPRGTSRKARNRFAFYAARRSDRQFPRKVGS
jgi:hypothetical protein